MQNRGYDSCGLGLIRDNEIHKYIAVSDKDFTAIKYLELATQSIINNYYVNGIAHTRWATHGGKTKENAHPHNDMFNRFSLVHNGIIENHNELRIELKKMGYKFYGQTDSEVVINYFHYLMNSGDSHIDNLRKLTNILRGSWAILIIDKMNPGKIYFIKHGSPLLFGYNKNKSQLFLTSELPGFSSCVNYYYALQDGEYGVISLDNFIISRYNYDIDTVPEDNFELSPYPYPHWTIKEIYDQPKAINSLLKDRFNNNHILFPEIDNSPCGNDVKQTDHFIFLGCGTSYNAAQIGARYFKKFNNRGTTFDVIDGADFEVSDIPISQNSMIQTNKKNITVILLSQSGETKDLCRALEIVKKMGLRSIGIINVENSLISREVDICIYLKAGREQAVASTKCFTNQYLMLLLLGMWFYKPNHEIQNTYTQNTYNAYFDALNTVENDFREMINNNTDEFHDIVKFLNNHTSCYILGKHISEWIAKEGSLKIKEIAGLHIESYSVSALKHGPYSLLRKHFPVIVLANDDSYYSKIDNTIEEMKSRNATVIVVTNRESIKKNYDYLFYLPVKSELFPLISNIILQKLAYELALVRKKNPDMPENLAKVVTVE
ncbi:MAG: putative glucosamine-fructose-6-phosphate aminotransferase [Terrestrivirus sp.]|uniref:glutamine--fructose-6-phosphate transaminase (isomerizing) n=1 Tax=Terrestrivirus sp. TaxID=2487775 RepID=A0A3G4ZMN9_9VIRU|nr:MAG: putative glucosamine-fructose-6-phosphate aminotransferase [Terrestrivirus sp.]